MRKGMLTAASPGLHRAVMGFKHLLEGKLPSCWRTSWLGFMWCLSPFGCHQKVSPREGQLLGQMRVVCPCGEGKGEVCSSASQTDWAGRACWNWLHLLRDSLKMNLLLFCEMEMSAWLRGQAQTTKGGVVWATSGGRDSEG